MIPSACLFTNVHGINQQYKLKPKIIFDRSFFFPGVPLEPYFERIFGNTETDCHLIRIFK